MSASLTRRGKVLLALVASMTLGSGLLLALAPKPMEPGLTESRLPLAAISNPTTAPGAANSGVAPASSVWKRIILHESASATGDLAALDAQHRKDYGGCAYHHVINTDGRTEASARWAEQQFSPADPANTTEPAIHIVLIGRFDRQGPTASQRAELARLIGKLSADYDIPASAVLLHRDVDPTCDCPGPKFVR